MFKPVCVIHSSCSSWEPRGAVTENWPVCVRSLLWLLLLCWPLEDLSFRTLLPYSRYSASQQIPAGEVVGRQQTLLKHRILTVGVCHFRKQQDRTCIPVLGFFQVHCSLVCFLSGLRIPFEQFYTDFQDLIVQITSTLIQKISTVSLMIAFNRIHEYGGPG